MILGLILFRPNDMEDSFVNRHKAIDALVDLITVSDTTWNQGLILKLLRTIPDRNLMRFSCVILPTVA